MKKTILVLLSLLFVLSACSNMNISNEHDTRSQNITPIQNTASVSRAPETLEQMLNSFPCVFEGTCLKHGPAPDSGPSSLMDVKIEKVYQGDLTEGDRVTVSTIVPDLFPIGRSCLIFAEPRENIFWQMSYLASNSTLYQKGDIVNQDVIMGLDNLSYEDVIQLVEEYVNRHPYENNDIVEGVYCKSNDLHEIFDASSAVLEVVPEIIIYNGLPDRTTYSCQVNRALKGDSEDSVMIISFKDSMEVGKHYILLLQLPQESSVFIPTAQNSVFPADSEEAELICSFQ